MNKRHREKPLDHPAANAHFFLSPTPTVCGPALPRLRQATERRLPHLHYPLYPNSPALLQTNLFKHTLQSALKSGCISCHFLPLPGVLKLTRLPLGRLLFLPQSPFSTG